VLERAGLVSSAREGRQVLYDVRAEAFERSAAWLTDVAANWDRRLEMIKAAAEAPDEPRATTASEP
jgi:hypothetical protein